MNLSTVTMITTNDNQHIEQNVVNSGTPDLSAQGQSFDQVLASTLTNNQKTAAKEEKMLDKNPSDNTGPQNTEIPSTTRAADQGLQAIASENISFHKTKKLMPDDEAPDSERTDGAISLAAGNMQTENKITLSSDVPPAVAAADQNLAAADETTSLLVTMIQASQTPVPAASATVTPASLATVENEQAATSAILTAMTPVKAASTGKDGLLSDDNMQNTLSSATTTSRSASSLSGRSLTEQSDAIADLKTRAQTLQQETSFRAASDTLSSTPTHQRGDLSAGSQSLSAMNLAVQQPLSVSAQAPAVQTSASIAPTVTAQINAQLGSDEWQQAVSQQVIMFTRNGQQNAELRLHPQELGALQISLKLDDNQASLHLVSANSQVRAAMEAALPQLRTSMAESGISLGQASVGSDASPGWQQQAQQQFQSNHSAEQNRVNDANGVQSASIVQTSAIGNAVSVSGGVDIFA
ncbi:hypothetical protein BIY29_03085 [Brenneria alni]|uniref:Flagellar hook-length control protein-like C-terminal domain-containing protein n=1 Tax=Brenneria alni TaxID=71656 RepID=A0A421DSB6_9GAMM|nr:flagellar hook-length control protein FliK [Brenneria alni]RLM27221.1 hypothetical protein BIY29_03085 [Brenneria alni]